MTCANSTKLFSNESVLRPTSFQLLRDYLDAEHRNKKKAPFNFAGWTDHILEVRRLRTSHLRRMSHLDHRTHHNKRTGTTVASSPASSLRHCLEAGRSSRSHRNTCPTFVGAWSGRYATNVFETASSVPFVILASAIRSFFQLDLISFSTPADMFRSIFLSLLACIDTLSHISGLSAISYIILAYLHTLQ